MPSLVKSRIVVAGAGVLGAAIALVLAREGASVTLADPSPLGENASGVAAGMLAPAFEAVLDPLMAAHFDLLKAARDLWPGFAAGLAGAELGLRRSGAVWIEIGEDTGSLDRHERALRAAGAQAERLSADRVRRLLPGVQVGAGGVHTTEDWRLSPALALAVLRQAAVQSGVTIAERRLIGFDAGTAHLSNGDAVAADAVVLATGAGRSDLAPETSCLSPIKGHILTLPGARDDNAPVVRCEGGYIVAGPDGLHLGATMETGRDDAAIDPAIVARLRAAGASLYPHLASAPFTARTGVRAATPDGLPLVGLSSRAGVYLATGARRNGWLLAPLVARMTAAYLAGGDPGPYASLFAARRFDRG